MPQMFGNLSIGSKLMALLAVPVLVATRTVAAAALRVQDGGREPALVAGGTVLGLTRRGQALAGRQLRLLDG